MHRFRDIAFDVSNVAIFGYHSCVLPPTWGFPSDDLRKILRGGQRMARLQNRNNAENFDRLSRSTNVTYDIQTRTDRRNCDDKYRNVTYSHSGKTFDRTSTISDPILSHIESIGFASGIFVPGTTLFIYCTSR